MKCPRCQTDNRDGARFCRECGATFGANCGRCGAEVEAGSKFCDGCGAPLAAGPPSPTTPTRFTAPESYTPRHLAERILRSRSALEGERKQVTVLFCDIVDSTRLAAALGSEQMHELLNEFFGVALDEVHRYEGTVNQFLGDGFMALFGAPIAHEDHTRRAALAALSIRRRVEELQTAAATSGLRDIQVRMGLNSGFLVVGKIGNDLRMDYTAIGDTTNVAARIQSAARPGDILMSDSARRLSEGYIDLEGLPPAVVKGKAEPLEIYRVLGVGTRRSPIEMVGGGTLASFVGRVEDMATLVEAVRRVRAGRGEVIGIEAEPGAGKSRLVHEFLRTLPSGVAHIVGRCVSYGSSIPHLPILDALHQQAGIADADEPSVVAEKLRQALVEARRPADIDNAYLLQFLGIKAGVEPHGSIDPATLKGRAFEIMRETFILAARRRPLVLIVEDLHWIDASSGEFLAELAAAVPSAPILLVVTYRPGSSLGWDIGAAATRIVLQPLSPRDSAAVVNNVFGDRVAPDDVTALILARGEGNPFFLEELARTVTERHEDETGDLVPATVQSVLAARIDRLPETHKQVVEIASVLGREFRLSLLRAVSERNRSLQSRLRALARMDLLYERGGADDPVYVFKHALTQEVAYESILSPRRRALHRAAAEALEAMYAGRLEERCELIAHHYSRAAEAAKAIDFLELANRKAIASHALTEARQFFLEALALLERQADTDDNRRCRVMLVLRQFPVYHFLHGHQEHHDLLVRYQPVVDSLGDVGLRGPFLVQLGQRVAVFTEFARAGEMFVEAARLCDASGNAADAAHAYVMLEWSAMITGEFGIAESMWERARERLQDIRAPVTDMFGDVGLSFAHTLAGRWGDAVRAAQVGFERGREASDDGIMAFCSAITSYAYVHQGDRDSALEHAHRALARAPTVYFRGWGQLALAAAQCMAGQFHPALETFESIIDLVRSVRHDLGYLLFAPLLGEAYVSAGQHDKARALLEEIRHRADRSGARSAMGRARRLLAELSVRMNPAQQEEPLAAPLFKEGIRILREIGAANDLALALAGYGRLRKRLGDVDAARRLLSEALGIFQHLGTIGEPDAVSRELAALAVQRPSVTPKA